MLESGLPSSDDPPPVSRQLASVAHKCRRQALSQQRGFQGEGQIEVAAQLTWESALWKLLLWLYGDTDTDLPGGSGSPPLLCAGRALLTQQRVAQILSEDEGLNK